MYYDLEKKERIKAGDLFRTNEGCDALVVEYIKSNNIIIEFQDKHRHEVRVEAAQLRNGQVSNPYYPSVLRKGYRGVGKYKGYVGNVMSKEYQIWSGMMLRCYSPDYHKRFPTYLDTTVCEEWLNFQVFAEWYTNHEFYGLDYHLDKDILVRGNKVYSPEKCTLVPVEINGLLIDSGSIRGDCPIGVHRIDKSCSYVAYLKRYGEDTLRNIL